MESGIVIPEQVEAGCRNPDLDHGTTAVEDPPPSEAPHHPDDIQLCWDEEEPLDHVIEGFMEGDSIDDEVCEKDLQVRMFLQ